MLTKETERKFDELVAFCRKLQGEGRLGSGWLVVIRNDRISLDPVPPHGPGAEAYNLEENVRQIRSGIQHARHALGEWFNLNSQDWNASNIGRMLKYIEENFREETYKVEQGGAYNSLVMYSLAKEAADLAVLLLSKRFSRHRWRWFKLRLLNEHAEEFFKRNQQRAVFRTISMSAQVVIGIDDLRRERNSTQGMDTLMQKMVETDLLSALKSFFT